MPVIASQKFNLCNIVLFIFAPHGLYYLEKPAEYYKSHGQALNKASLPRLLLVRGVVLKQHITEEASRFRNKVAKIMPAEKRSFNFSCT